MQVYVTFCLVTIIKQKASKTTLQLMPNFLIIFCLYAELDFCPLITSFLSPGMCQECGRFCWHSTAHCVMVVLFRQEGSVGFTG